MSMVKEGLLELKEIKEMLKDPKKVDKNSEGRENSVNDEEMKGRSVESGINFEKEEEEEKRVTSWARRVEKF